MGSAGDRSSTAPSSMLPSAADEKAHYSGWQHLPTAGSTSGAAMPPEKAAPRVVTGAAEMSGPSAGSGSGAGPSGAGGREGAVSPGVGISGRDGALSPTPGLPPPVYSP
jgi:hypothetical protein